MAKQRTYTGTKKGTSAARQGRRSRVVGGGSGTSGANNGKQEYRSVRDTPEYKERQKKSFIQNIIINAAVLGGFAIMLLLRGTNTAPKKVSIPIMVGLGVLIVIVFIVQMRQQKKLGL